MMQKPTWMICAVIFAAGSLASADPGRNCGGAHVVYGKVTCSGPGSAESSGLLDAYFYGATSIDEITSRYPERLERFRNRCLKKALARDLASAPAGAAIERTAVELRVSTTESCKGGQGYQEPCTRNEDCLENFCHPDRGTCSAVFTVPMTAAH